MIKIFLIIIILIIVYQICKVATNNNYNNHNNSYENSEIDSDSESESEDEIEKFGNIGTPFYAGLSNYQLDSDTTANNTLNGMNIPVSTTENTRNAKGIYKPYKLNKYFIQTQFNDSYRDVMTAFNSVAPDQKKMFNIQMLPVTTTIYNPNKDTYDIFNPKVLYSSFPDQNKIGILIIIISNPNKDDILIKISKNIFLYF